MRTHDDTQWHASQVEGEAHCTARRTATAVPVQTPRDLQFILWSDASPLCPAHMGFPCRQRQHPASQFWGHVVMCWCRPCACVPASCVSFPSCQVLLCGCVWMVSTCTWGPTARFLLISTCSRLVSAFVLIALSCLLQMLLSLSRLCVILVC